MSLIQATIRNTKTRGELNALRKNGDVPGIIYGGENANEKISLSKKEVKNLINKENFLSNVISIKLDEKEQKVLPREITFDTISDEPTHIDYLALLCAFWEAHDPTQGMRQGNDIGTQYRSSIYTVDSDQAQLATESKQNYGKTLAAAGRSAITTEIAAATAFYYAEDYHQQYLSKNPTGYCGLGGTGVLFS